MAKSPEYPDLLWMPPKSWTNANRSSVQLVVIHTTEGAARASAAEDGASYDQRRTDGTSTHYFHDSTSTVQCVHTADQAHAARAQGNRRGIQHELCTRADSANWADAYHQALLKRAAKQAARDAKKWGIPVRHLTVSQVADGAKGFCGHYDVTRAFPQDKGTHSDPGSNFPWTQFLNLVRAELAPSPTPAKLEEDDMPTATEIAQAVWAYPLQDPADPKVTKSAAAYQRWNDLVNDAAANKVITKLSPLITAGKVDTGELVAALAPAVAGLVIAALPEDRDDITPAELQEAIVGVLKALVDDQPVS
jgi:N-acetyl-anhydromuramyl-L-alanine amidase AmpD